MDAKQAQESASAIEQMWEVDLGPARDAWIEALMPLDSAIVAAAILKGYERGKRPTIEGLIAATKEMERQRAEIEARSPHVRTGPAEEEPVVFAIELAPWVKGWAVARYRHNDFRVFPEQRPGYDRIQTAHPSHRTHVWPNQELIDPADAARYIEEGAPLATDDIFRMIAQ